MLGNNKNIIGFESNYYKSGGNNLPTVYSFTVYISCDETISIYSINSILTIGSLVYLNINLTSPFESNGFNEGGFPGPILPIGFASDSNGLIYTNTAEIGGCN